MVVENSGRGIRVLGCLNMGADKRSAPISKKEDSVLRPLGNWRAS